MADGKDKDEKRTAKSEVPQKRQSAVLITEGKQIRGTAQDGRQVTKPQAFQSGRQVVITQNVIAKPLYERPAEPKPIKKSK